MTRGTNARWIATRAVWRLSIAVAVLGPLPAYGQESLPPAAVAPVASTDASAAGNRPERAAQAAAAQPPAPAPDILHRDVLTGDWNGARTTWKNKGVDLASSLTQFYQGVSSGGTGTSSEYNGTAQAKLDFDFGKLAGWNNWSAEIKAEMRFGGPLVTSTGTISPVNTAAIIPGSDGTVFAVTAVNVTRVFPINLKEGKLVVLSFGRYNLVDALDEDFFAGGGTERFLNLAQIGPLTVLRQVPLITNAVNLAYVRGGEPFFTFSLLDPNDHSTDPGLSDLFADGVTFAPALNLSAKYLGKTAKHTFGGAITTKAYTPLTRFTKPSFPGRPSTPSNRSEGHGPSTTRSGSTSSNAQHEMAGGSSGKSLLPIRRRVR
jgi:hypothetical protein